MPMLVYNGKQNRKTLIMVAATKHAQAQGKKMFWATNNLAETAALLAKHGALCEVIGESFLLPHFPKRRP